MILKNNDFPIRYNAKYRCAYIAILPDKHIFLIIDVDIHETAIKKNK